MIALSALTFFAIGLCLHQQVNGIALIFLLFFITGIVATSRLYMQAHTIKELLFGYIIGMIPQILLFYIWL